MNDQQPMDDAVRTVNLHQDVPPLQQAIAREARRVSEVQVSAACPSEQKRLLTIRVEQAVAKAQQMVAAKVVDQHPDIVYPLRCRGPVPQQNRPVVPPSEWAQ